MPYFQPEQGRDVDVEQRQRCLFDEFAVRQNSSQRQAVFGGVINLHVVVARVRSEPEQGRDVDVEQRQRCLFDEFAVRQNSSQRQAVFGGVINLHVVVARV